jgi:hypothetical protein
MDARVPQFCGQSVADRGYVLIGGAKWLTSLVERTIFDGLAGPRRARSPRYSMQGKSSRIAPSMSILAKLAKKSLEDYRMSNQPGVEPNAE